MGKKRAIDFGIRSDHIGDLRCFFDDVGVYEAGGSVEIHDDPKPPQRCRQIGSYDEKMAGQKRSVRIGIRTFSDDCQRSFYHDGDLCQAKRSGWSLSN